MENTNQSNHNPHNTQLDPNNGSQIVVENNTGTININNYPNNDKIFTCYREDNERQWRELGRAFEEIRSELKKIKKKSK